jgi:hypothetical protein
VVVVLLLWEGRADECVWARVRGWIDDGCRERERERRGAMMRPRKAKEKQTICHDIRFLELRLDVIVGMIRALDKTLKSKLR